MKKVINVLSAVILVVTFVLVFILVFTRIQGKTPQLFGYQILRVSTSSMSPKLEVGDIILSESIDVASIKTGDIITYNGEYGSYAGKLITHEVIADPYETDGKLYLQTMGIANGYVDPEISEEQVIGKMVCSLPFFSAVYNFFMTPWGLILVLAFLAVLFVNELFSLIRTVKNKKDNLSQDETKDNIV